MMLRTITALVFAAAMLATGGAYAQQATTPAAPAPYPLDNIPDKMPWANAYGAPITLQRAQAAINAAVAEANKRGWPLVITVMDSGANLVAVVRMDGAQLASLAISEHKARAAVKFRRPTKVFEEGVQKSGFNYLLSLDDIVGSRGGIPLIDDNKIIGAIGCSGGTGSQDEVVCMAGAATINK